tara:strand:+ start:11390 stop:11854 length:465 start_codon:yes stop_codon:yes gene_type:complete
MPKFTQQQITEREEKVSVQIKEAQLATEKEDKEYEELLKRQQAKSDNSIDGYYVQALGNNEYGLQMVSTKIDDSYEIIIPFDGQVSPGYELYIERNNAGVLEQRIRKENLGYGAERKLHYPSIPEQLDMIYHNIDKWKETIKEIKDLHPKGDKQ